MRDITLNDVQLAMNNGGKSAKFLLEALTTLDAWDLPIMAGEKSNETEKICEISTMNSPLVDASENLRRALEMLVEDGFGDEVVFFTDEDLTLSEPIPFKQPTVHTYKTYDGNHIISMSYLSI
jgi:hypothetical protein